MIAKRARGYDVSASGTRDASFISALALARPALPRLASHSHLYSNLHVGGCSTYTLRKQPASWTARSHFSAHVKIHEPAVVSYVDVAINTDGPIPFQIASDKRQQPIWWVRPHHLVVFSRNLTAGGAECMAAEGGRGIDGPMNPSRTLLDSRELHRWLP